MSDKRRKVLLNGQPQRGAARQATVPIRFEKLLVRAAGDPAFRQALLTDREAAAKSAGLVLSATERGMLRVMSDERLAAMIDAIDLRRHTRRPFGRSVAAAVFAAAAASTVVVTDCGCGGNTGDRLPPVFDTGQSQPLSEKAPKEAPEPNLSVPTTNGDVVPIPAMGACRGMRYDMPKEPGK